jgi:hypothetical protein
VIEIHAITHKSVDLVMLLVDGRPVIPGCNDHAACDKPLAEITLEDPISA